MNFDDMSFDEIKDYYYENGISHAAIGRLIYLHEQLLTELEELSYLSDDVI